MKRKRLLGAMLPLFAACALVGCGDSKNAEEGRAQLTQRVAQQLEAAQAKADAYEFDAAKAILRDLPEEVDKSPFANVATCDKLTADIDAIRRAVFDEEAECRRKTRAGWKLIDGHLVSPADQERALAEKKRREEQAAKRKEEERRMAHARAKAEAEAREKESRRRRAVEEAEKELARQAAEKAAAQRMVADTVRNLPSLQTALDDYRYIADRTHWLLWYISLELVSLGGDPPEHGPWDYQMLPKDLTKYVESVTPSASPILVAYRDEILDIMQTLRYRAYVSSPDERKCGQVPIRFANHGGKPVLLIGSVLADTSFNNVNQAMNTPKKRAAAFMQREVLPVLLSGQIPERLKSAQLGYFGIMFVYGNSNFVRDNDTPTPESLCIVLSMRDYVAFADRELSQESLVKNSQIFLASAGSKFIKVELSLE